MTDKIKSNFHTHTLLCDGINTPEEMVIAAVDKGFDTLGFSGHCYTAYDESYCMSRENTLKYKTEIARLQEKYRGQLNILRGIEQDFGSDEPTYDYDYVIGSVHALFPNADADSTDNFHGYDRSRYYYIDWSPEETERTVKELCGGDPYTMCEHYFRMVSMLPEVTGCNIIGHFDLITKFNEKHPVFDEGHPRYVKAALDAVDRLMENNIIFEINTGAMAKGWKTAPYPAPWILKYIASKGGSVIINSDCHNADFLDFAFDKALALAEDCGVNVLPLLPCLDLQRA